MRSFIDLDNNGVYRQLLSAVARLSGLFSESSTPYINYRLVENIFCRSFNAKNLSRSDTAFDANFHSIGIGLKTFTCPHNSSVEKVAEFNSLSPILSNLQTEALAVKLAEYRNDRIELAQRTYNIESSVYHIVARQDGKLLVFETDYDKIDIDKIHSVKNLNASLQFEDEKNQYSFNHSKSTLFRKFIIPPNAYTLPIEIVENPYDLLLELFDKKVFNSSADEYVQGVDYVILPLYTTKGGRRVPERSGLNQWNANGRERDFGEVYIPIPKIIHDYYPDFFPPRDTQFNLEVPSGEMLTAKVCQDNSKALMTNPNKALSDWLLRKVLNLREGELATIEMLDALGFDSVIIYKTNSNDYRIDKIKDENDLQFKNAITSMPSR
jgi:hypothetical protein